MEELILNHVFFNFKIGEAPDGGPCDEPQQQRDSQEWQ